MTPGCHLTPRERIAREIPGLQRQWQTNVAHQAALPVQELTWPEAVALLQTNNLKIRRARLDITNSQENYRQVYKDLLPTLDFHGSASHTLEHISSMSFSDVTFNIDSFFNFPGFATMAARLFTTRLTILRTITVAQLAEREQTIELYKLLFGFLEAEEMAEDLRLDQTLADRIRPVDEFTAQVLMQEIKTRRLTLEKTREQLQGKASELLGSKDKLWVFKTNSWPLLNYDQQPLLLTDTNAIGQLQVRMLAIELVGAWAVIQGLKLQYWPEVSLYISGPPVYYYSVDGGKFWDAGQVQATADLFWRIDTRGNISRQVRQTRRDQELEKERLRLEAITLISKLVTAQKIASAVREQLARAEELLTVLARVPSPQQFSALLSAIEASRSLREQQRQLRRDLAEINALFWFVDDAKWPTWTNLPP